jgi:catechol 2,3-dioxygenase-like lactoylglutathione lyase family enzyme
MGDMEVRIARHTDQLEAVVRFYRDLVGLPEIGGFHDHDGYDGAFLDLPGTGAHLELTTGGGHDGPVPHPESLLVLYFESDAEIEAIVARMPEPPVEPANPYWRRAAVAYADPDGFQVILTRAR